MRGSLVLAALAWLCFASPTTGQSPAVTPLQAMLAVTQPRDGDIVFRRGTSLRSEAVLMADTEPEFSHVGVVVLEGGMPFVVHALPASDADPVDGVREEPLADYLAPQQASQAALYRFRQPPAPAGTRGATTGDAPDSAPASGRDAPASAAPAASGAAAASREMAAQHLPFDGRFDLATAGRVYCTELVLRAYALAGIDLQVTPVRAARPFIDHPIVYPSDLQRSPALVRVF